VVDEAVLWGVVLRLQCAEERLFRAEDLDRGGGALGQARERAGVCDQAGADELADQCGQVGRDSLHAGGEVRG